MDRHHDLASANLAAPSIAGAGDALSDVLRTVKLSGALFFLVEASSPWGVDIPPASEFAANLFPRARPIVSYHVVVDGSGWASVGGQPAVRFAPGDVIVFPHGDSYTMLSEPGGAPALPREQALGFFRAMAAGELPFIVPEGGGGPERAQFVCGFLGCDTRPFNPLLATLPRLMQVRRLGAAQGDMLDRLIALTLAEAEGRRPGGECMRAGLGELMFLEVVRRYIAGLPAHDTGWLAGLRDPAVGRALALIHARPAHPWTLETLAAESGLSRSALAERFARLVGYPAMQYLARWRIQVAARLLADGAAKVGAVGREVGYASEAAFSPTLKQLARIAAADWRDRGS